MSRKNATIVKYSGPIWGIGETVLIKRPHLWAGAFGEVISVNNGMHRVKIAAKKDGSTFSAFHTDVDGKLLEEWI